MDGIGRLVARAGHGDSALEVYESAGRRWLQHANGVLQSAMDLTSPWRPVLPYTRAMLTALSLLDAPPARAVLLGLGGGSLVRFLRHHFRECHVVVVERDPDCVAMAREHFGIAPTDPRIEVIVADARDALAELPGPADLLLVDLFDADGMGAWLADWTFYRDCTACFAPGAALAVNLWVEPDDEDLAAIAAVETGTGQPCLLVPLAGYRNVIALARADRAPLPNLRTLEAWARRTARRHGIDPRHMLAPSNPAAVG